MCCIKSTPPAAFPAVKPSVAVAPQRLTWEVPFAARPVLQPKPAPAATPAPPQVVRVAFTTRLPCTTMGEVLWQELNGW